MSSVVVVADAAGRKMDERGGKRSEGKVVWCVSGGGGEGDVGGFIMRLYVCVAESIPRPLLLLSIIATEVTVCRPL